MSPRSFILKLLTLSILALGLSLAHAKNCEEILKSPASLPPHSRSSGPTLEDDLLKFHAAEVKHLSSFAIEARNEEAILRIKNESPEPVPGRSHLTSDVLHRLLGTLKGTELSIQLSGREYEKDPGRIAFCFGRATFIHLALLKMGVPKTHIRKIWLVGPNKMYRTQEKPWAFHVAALVYTADKGWMTLDTNEVKPEPVEDWASSQLHHSTDGRARIYVTEAKRFGPRPGAYDRLQMGLSLPRDEDWYRGYFKDLMSALRVLDVGDFRAAL